MESKIINAVCMGAAVVVIVAGKSIIEEEINRIYIPREPRVMQLLNENSILITF